MAQSKTPSYQVSFIFCGALIILYLSLGFIPNLEAVDKIAPQWLGLTCLNFVSLGYLYHQKIRFSIPITSILTSWLSLTYIIFILWAGLSYFYAINSTEVIVNITRQINVLIMLLTMGVMLYQFPNKIQFVSWCITLILVIEVYAIIIEAQEMVNTTGVITSGSLKGVTANRNITAFSLVIKIPFVLFLLHAILNKFAKIILNVLILFTLVCLSMIQSRASFVAVGIVLIGHVGLYLFLFLKDKRLHSIYRIGYFVLPLIASILINQSYLSKLGTDAVSRAATISVSTNDGSINQRLRYYEDVLTHIRFNPIFGVGLGNWKLKSIEYDAKDIVGYVVPYHAHSDFIQLGAELGILGFLLYIGIFIWAIYFVYRLLRYSTLSENEKIFIFLLFVSLGVYSVDASLNFPIARPQVLVDWAVIMAILTGYYQSSFKTKEKRNANKTLNVSFIALGILVLLPSIYVTKQVYESLKGQMFLLQDFNSNQFNVPLKQVETIVPDIPNITVTTIPINSIKARYYVNAKQFDKALNLIEKGIPANPFLFYSEYLKSVIYKEKGNRDSSYHYAKLAFLGLPRNQLHSSTFINEIIDTKITKDLDLFYDNIKLFKNSNDYFNYLFAATSLSNKNDSILIERINDALSLFPDEKRFKDILINYTVGVENVNASNSFSVKGLEDFNNKKYISAAENFEKAIKYNPYDYAHYENAATSNYLNGNLEKALEQIDMVIKNMNPLNGKCEYIKALIFIRMGDPIGACPLLETARDSGFTQAEGTLSQYCQQ